MSDKKTISDALFEVQRRINEQRMKNSAYNVNSIEEAGQNYPVYNKNSAPAQDFRSAFAAARKTAGGPNGTFTWQGRQYNTALQGEKSNTGKPSYEPSFTAPKTGVAMPASAAASAPSVTSSDDDKATRAAVASKNSVGSADNNPMGDSNSPSDTYQDKAAEELAAAKQARMNTTGAKGSDTDKPPALPNQMKSVGGRPMSYMSGAPVTPLTVKQEPTSPKPNIPAGIEAPKAGEEDQKSGAMDTEPKPVSPPTYTRDETLDQSEDGQVKKGSKKKMSESTNPLINAFLKLQNAEVDNIFEAAKKAKKDWDKDGKIESEKDEVWGSRFRAAKKAGKMEEEADLDEVKIVAPFGDLSGKGTPERKAAADEAHRLHKAGQLNQKMGQGAVDAFNAAAKHSNSPAMPQSKRGAPILKAVKEETVENSAADKKADAAGEKKYGMTHKEWEKSPMDKKADAKILKKLGEAAPPEDSWDENSPEKRKATMKSRLNTVKIPGQKNMGEESLFSEEELAHFAAVMETAEAPQTDVQGSDVNKTQDANILDEDGKKRGRPSKKDQEANPNAGQGRDPRQHIQVKAGEAMGGRVIDFKHNNGDVSKITPPMGRRIVAHLDSLKPAERQAAVSKMHDSPEGLKV